MSDDVERGIGDNNPPPEENPLLKIDPEKLLKIDHHKLVGLLTLQYGALMKRQEDFMLDIDKWIEDHTVPETNKLAWAKGRPKPAVGDEQDLIDTTDFVKQIKAFVTKEIEVTRKKVKAPLDDAGKIIQEFFAKDLKDPLESALRHVVDAQSLALIQKEQAERQRLRAEAMAKAQEANRLAIQARRATGVVEKESLTQKAMVVEDEAANLEKMAEASVAEVSRTRTDMGQVTGLRVRWEFEVVQIIDLLMAIMAGRQDLLPCIQVNEVYVNSIIRGQNGVRDIPGLAIREVKTAG